MPALTPRQREVLEDYIETADQAETGRRLNLATQTVKNLMLRARRRAGVTKTSQLVYLLATGDLDRMEENELESVETQQEVQA